MTCIATLVPWYRGSAEKLFFFYAFIACPPVLLSFSLLILAFSPPPFFLSRLACAMKCCSRQPLSGPSDPCSMLFTNLGISSPCNWLLICRIWQHWGDVTAVIRLQKSDFCLANGVSLLMVLLKQAAVLVRPTWQSAEDGLWLTSSKKQGPLVQQPQRTKSCQWPHK